MNRDEKKQVRIENWKLLGLGRTGYMAPEQVAMVLIGDAPDHPLTKIHGNHQIRTSEVLWFSHTSGLAETANTIYSLGKPDLDWLAWIEKSGFALDHYSIEKI